MGRSRAVVAAARERGGGVCAQCGEASERLEVDHRIALCNGGADTAENTRLLCAQCHRRKTRADRRQLAKTRRIRRKHYGEGKARLRRKVSGEVVRDTDYAR